METTVKLPCRIGETVWGVSTYNKSQKVRLGVVSEMVFNSNMELIITVRGISRGRWGESVFSTEAEAKAAVANNKVKVESKVSSKQYATGDTLCWSCKKSGGLCSWSQRLEPVKGWKATESNYYGGCEKQKTYTVHECPQFEEG